MSFCGCCPYFFAEFGGITGVPAYKREEWIENYWKKQPNFVAAVCDDIYIERQEQQHWGWEKLEKLCRKYFWRSGKARIFVFIYSLRSEMAGIVVGDFERICLSRPCVLTLLERVFSIYFQAGWSRGRFAPEKVFDVICWCLVKCDDSAKIVWKKSEKYLDN